MEMAMNAMLTPQQAAARIGTSVSLIYQLCHEGLLPHFRFGGKGKRGRLMIDENDFEAFVACSRCDARQIPTILKHIQG